MSTDSREEFKPNSTHGKFWGGYMLEKIPYGILVVFGGFFGLDKIALRSPLTAFLKFIVNILFLGAWWVYDILQLFFDQKFVAQYGHTTPFGVSGHGYQLIHGLTKEKKHELPDPSPYYNGVVSTFLFILYVSLASFMGFTGLPNIAYGDHFGGLSKLISNVFILPMVVNMIYQMIDVYRSSTLEKDGLSRPWPTTAGLVFLGDKYPATLLLPSEQANTQEKAYLARDTAMRETTYVTNEDGVQVLDKVTNKPKILQKGQRTGLETIYDFTRSFLKRFWPVYAASELADKGQGAMEAFSDASTQVAKKDPEVLLEALSGKQASPPLLSSKPTLPEQGPNDATFSVANPMHAKKQTGGALIGMSSEWDTVLLISMGVLIVGGFAAALFRKFSVPKREEDDEYPRKAYDRDDPPPNPGGV